MTAGTRLPGSWRGAYALPTRPETSRGEQYVCGAGGRGVLGGPASVTRNTRRARGLVNNTFLTASPCMAVWARWAAPSHYYMDDDSNEATRLSILAGW